MNILAAISTVLCTAGIASAGVVNIGFEGAAPLGNLLNVNPDVPYSEAGFTFIPLNGSSAIFDAADGTDMPGNEDSSFFGWGGSNIITLTRDGGGVFGFDNLLLGNSTLANGPASITLVAHFNGGDTANMTFSDLNSAFFAQVGWVNLVAVEFRTTDDAAMDNLNLNFVPAPGALGLLSLTGLVAIRRRR